MKDGSVLRHWALALLVLCAACVGIERGYPDRRYFVLEVPAKVNPSNPTSGETLQVSNIRVSPRYADRGFVYRTSESAYESDFYHQFLVPPAALMTEEIRKGLIAAEVFQICHQSIEPVAAELRLGRFGECALRRFSQPRLASGRSGDGVFRDQ